MLDNRYVSHAVYTYYGTSRKRVENQTNTEDLGIFVPEQMIRSMLLFLIVREFSSNHLSNLVKVAITSKILQMTEEVII